MLARVLEFATAGLSGQLLVEGLPEMEGNPFSPPRAVDSRGNQIKLDKLPAPNTFFNGSQINFLVSSSDLSLQIQRPDLILLVTL